MKCGFVERNKMHLNLWAFALINVANGCGMPLAEPWEERKISPNKGLILVQIGSRVLSYKYQGTSHTYTGVWHGVCRPSNRFTCSTLKKCGQHEGMQTALPIGALHDKILTHGSMWGKSKCGSPLYESKGRWGPHTIAGPPHIRLLKHLKIWFRRYGGYLA